MKNEAGNIPQSVASFVQRALAILLDVKTGIDHARETDGAFDGRGRYEREAREKSASVIAGRMLALDKFLALAKANGIDGGAYISSLGGIPDMSQTGPVARPAPRANPHHRSLTALQGLA